LNTPPKAVERLASMQNCASLYEQANTGLIPVAVLSGLMVVIAHRFAPDTNLIFWYGIVLAVLVARFGLVALFRREQHLAKPKMWIALNIAGAFASAVLFSWASVSLISEQDITLTAVTCTMIFGTATGAIPILASIWRGYILYLITMVLPPVVALATLETTTLISSGSILAVSGVLLMITLAVTSLIYSRAIARGNLSELDPLTHCANRRLLERALKSNRMPAGTKPGALALIDLDRFKAINDTAGHEAGDNVLTEIARLLESICDSEDVVSRIGGDEFVVLFSEREEKNVERCVEDMRTAIAEKGFHFDAHSFHVSTSVGLVFLADETVHSGAVASADIAAYAAKKQGGNRVRRFTLDDADMLENQNDLQWRTRLEDAIESDRLTLVCQEIVPVDEAENNNQKVYFETLVRLIDRNGELVDAADFVPAIQRLGLSSQLDRWLTSAAINWAAENSDILDRVGWLSINLSVRTVGNSDFASYVETLLIDAGVPGNKICFELTEHEAILDYTTVMSFMTQLRSMGCRFALDDFGTGYSSLQYLHTLPIDVLKIDRTFVTNALHSEQSLAILRAIQELATNVDKLVVAEGVEDDATIETLKKLGIDMMQGYGIMMPTRLDEWTLAHRKQLAEENASSTVVSIDAKRERLTPI